MIPSSTILLRLLYQIQSLTHTHIATRNKNETNKINKAVRHHYKTMAQTISVSLLGSVAVDKGQTDFTYTMSSMQPEDTAIY